MNFNRETIRSAPPTFSVSAEVSNCDVDIITLPLDEQKNGEAAEVNANVYSIGFFEQTPGSLADDPIKRAPQSNFGNREI